MSSATESATPLELCSVNSDPNLAKTAIQVTKNQPFSSNKEEVDKTTFCDEKANNQRTSMEDGSLVTPNNIKGGGEPFDSVILREILGKKDEEVINSFDKLSTKNTTQCSQVEPSPIKDIQHSEVVKRKDEGLNNGSSKRLCIESTSSKNESPARLVEMKKSSSKQMGKVTLVKKQLITKLVSSSLKSDKANNCINLNSLQEKYCVLNKNQKIILRKSCVSSLKKSKTTNNPEKVTSSPTSNLLNDDFLQYKKKVDMFLQKLSSPNFQNPTKIEKVEPVKQKLSTPKSQPLLKVKPFLSAQDLSNLEALLAQIKSQCRNRTDRESSLISIINPLNKLCDKIHELHEVNENHKKDIAMYAKRIEAFEQLISALRTEHKKEINNLKKDKRSLKQKNHNKEYRIIKLKHDIKQLNSQSESDMPKQYGPSVDLTEYEKEITILKRENSLLRQINQGQECQIKKLQSDMLKNHASSVDPMIVGNTLRDLLTVEESQESSIDLNKTPEFIKVESVDEPSTAESQHTEDKGDKPTYFEIISSSSRSEVNSSTSQDDECDGDTCESISSSVPGKDTECSTSKEINTVEEIQECSIDLREETSALIKVVPEDVPSKVESQDKQNKSIYFEIIGNPIKSEVIISDWVSEDESNS